MSAATGKFPGRCNGSVDYRLYPAGEIATRGSIELSGTLTRGSAVRIADTVNAAALPYALTVVSSNAAH